MAQRVTKVRLTSIDVNMYGGLFKGRIGLKEDPYPRTFNILFTGFGRSIQNWVGKSYEGKSDDERAVLNGIINQELTRLFKEHVRPNFQLEAPEDPTDTEAWNSPWWKPPTLRDSIMRSPLIKRSLSKGTLEVALRMRWYGWLTIEGRRPYVAEHTQHYMLKDGDWITVRKGDTVGGSTHYNDPLTGQTPEERMSWAGRAYYKSVPAMEQTRSMIAQRVLNEAFTQSLAKATAAIVQEQARAARKADFNVFRRSL